MYRSSRLPRLSRLAALMLAAPLLAAAQTLPPPAATDPVTLGMMQGFPPPADRQVRLGTILKYPNLRWAYHHMRELGPTAPVWRGTGQASVLDAAPRDLDSLAFENHKGERTTLADWQRNTYTDALLVMHQGKVVYERYHAGMTPASTHMLASMSKSLTGLLATELIQQGLINPEATVSSYLPELKNSAWADATVQQTLDMTTGVQYSENFADPKAGVFQYLMAAGLVPAPAAYAGPRTMTDYLPTVRKQGEHGAAFEYKSVDTEVIGWLIQRVTGQRYSELLSQRLWTPLGMQEDGYVWVDPQGGQTTSVGVSATLRDLGRLGEMLRQQGRYNGRQVISAASVAQIRGGADPQKFRAAGMTMRDGYSYHNHWWIPHDRDGSFEAKGLNGQHLHINPAAGLVVVKLSSHPVPNTAFTHNLDRRAFAALAQALAH
ncbi:MAG: serine hydrolase [Ramlibacter sp.]|nr:serine hydrolase [Ramlibacter sp.]